MSSFRVSDFEVSLNLGRKYTVATILFVAFVLRLFRYTVRSILRKEYVLDEKIATIKYSAMGPIQLFTRLPHKDTHPPLYYLFVHYWRAAFGASLASLRFPSIVFGTATVFAVYLVGTELKDEQTGLIAAILLTVSPFFISVSQYARAYALFGLSITLSWYYLLRFRRAYSRSLAVGYVISTAVMVSIHLYGDFLVIGQWVFLAAAATILSEGYPVRRVIGLQVLSAVLVSPVLGEIGYMVYTHPSSKSVPHLALPTPTIFLNSLVTYMGGQTSVPLALLLLGLTGVLGVLYLLRSLPFLDGWYLPFDTPLAAADCTFLASWGLPVVILPVAISYVLIHMWDDVSAIGTVLALVMSTALAIRELKFRWLKYGVLGAFVGLDLVILALYYIHA